MQRQCFKDWDWWWFHSKTWHTTQMYPPYQEMAKEAIEVAHALANWWIGSTFYVFLFNFSLVPRFLFNFSLWGNVVQTTSLRLRIKEQLRSMYKEASHFSLMPRSAMCFWSLWPLIVNRACCFHARKLFSSNWIRECLRNEARAFSHGWIKSSDTYQRITNKGEDNR